MRRILLLTIAAVVLLGAGLARAELTQHGDVRLDFNGRFAPKVLPRDRDAPVSVLIGGSVTSVHGGRPPGLRQISIAVNRYSKVYTRGLPRCEPGMLQSTSTEEALERCRPALVGTGHFGAIVDFSNDQFPVEGRILAFNSGSSRHPRLLLHIYNANPAKTTIVLKFGISHPARGDFGTVFTARIPEIASDLGYVTDLSLHFDRQYRFRGEPRSFLSARCAAPAGFGGGPFAFARGRFDFDNGQRLSMTLTRVCQVR
ncbi:MAG TPA: hypothetical protein VH476_09850 [Solirubrobacterales bacterium]